MNVDAQNLFYQTQQILEPMSEEFARLLARRAVISEKLWFALDTARQAKEEPVPARAMAAVVETTEKAHQLGLELLRINKSLSELALALHHTCNVAN